MRLSFEQASARFSHIDGVISNVRVDHPSAAVEFVVRFYPWWEHPRYADAVRRGARWKFSGTAGAERDCALHAADVEVLHIEAGSAATDLGFHREHPLLWQHDQDRRVLIVNSDVEVAALLPVVEARLRGAGLGCSGTQVLAFLNVNGPPGVRAPASIGSLPRFLHSLVVEALGDIGVEVFRQDPRWQERSSRLLLTIDECYVIAHDVSMNVPKFDHPDEVYVGE